MLSRFSKAIGLMTYSPEFGIFSCTKILFCYIYCNWELLCFIYRYNIDEHEFRCNRHFSVTIQRYFYLSVKIWRKILFFPWDFNFLWFSFAYRSVLEPNTFSRCSRGLYKNVERANDYLSIQVPSNFSQRTHKIFAFPIVLFVSNRYVKNNIALGHQKRLNAYCSVSIHYSADDFLRVKSISQQWWWNVFIKKNSKKQTLTCIALCLQVRNTAQ